MRMDIEDLKKTFFTDADVVRSRLEPLVTKTRLHCEIDKSGQVIITNSKLSNRDKIVVVLIARAIAGELDSSIGGDVTVTELTNATRLPKNHIRARITDAIKARLVDSPRPGVYRAVPHKIEEFLNSLDEN